MFTGDSPVDRRRGLRRGAAHVPAGNDYEQVEIDGARPDDHVDGGRRARPTLERVWLDDARPRAGRTVPLKVLLRTYRGDEIIAHGADRDSRQRDRHADAAGHRRRAPGAVRTARDAPPPQPRSVAQMIRRSTRRARNNALYVRLLAATPAPSSTARRCRRCRRRCWPCSRRPQQRRLHAAPAAPRSASGSSPTDHAVSGARTLDASRSTGTDAPFPPRRPVSHVQTIPSPAACSCVPSC